MNAQSLAQVVVLKQHDMSMIGITRVKGMTSIRKLYNFAYDCVSTHATYNKLDGFYSLSVDSLPDFTKHEFAALIMSHCEDYASEANGPDNKHWDSKMLPALLRYLQNSTDRDEEIEFTKTWRDCVTDYMTFKMEELIDEALSEYNEEMGCDTSPESMYGVRAHGEI